MPAAATTNENDSHGNSKLADGRSPWKWLLHVAWVLLLVAGGIAWYVHAASLYQAEQAALVKLESLLDDRGIRVVTSESELADTGPGDVAAVIRSEWAYADWLRGVMEATGDPILQRVKTITIYDADVNDAVVEPLTKFSCLDELKISAEADISRDGLRQFKRVLPKTIIWIAHDEPGFEAAAEEDEQHESDAEGEDLPLGNEDAT